MKPLSVNREVGGRGRAEDGGEDGKSVEDASHKESE